MASNVVYDTFDSNKERSEYECDITASHVYERTFSITEIFNVEDFSKQLEYKTSCCKSSSWDIMTQIEKYRPFKGFKILVILKRIDSFDFVVKGILVIWFLNKEGKKCPISYRLICTIGGQRETFDVFDVDPHYKCLLRKEDGMFPGDELVVKVQLFVKGCCERKMKDEPEIGTQSMEAGTSKGLSFPRL